MEFSDFLKATPSWISSSKFDAVSLYSAVRVCRNFNSIVYPDKISGTQLSTIEAMTDKTLESLLSSGKVLKINLETLTDNEILVLSEKRLIPYLKLGERNFIRLYMMSDYPVFLLINYKDHLTFFSFAANNGLKKASQDLSKLLNLFDDKNFQRNQEFGYLTSDLNFTGTGAKYFMVADLPYLRYSGKMFQITTAFKHNGVIYTKFFNQGSDLEDFLMIANKDSFSADEDEIKDLMTDLHSQLQMHEVERKILFENEDESIVLARIRKILSRESFSFKNYLDLYFMLIILAERGFDKRISRSWLRKKLYEYQPGHYSLLAGKLVSQADYVKSVAEEIKIKFKFLK